MAGQFIFPALTEQSLLQFATELSAVLTAGDTLLLSGDLGSGKTTLARAIIQTLQADHGLTEDVPSPTFTLVQTYQAGPLAIQHADLYRLGDGDELWELGIADAFDTHLSLIEWPDIAADDMPKSALRVTLSPTPQDHRKLQLDWQDAGWDNRISDLPIAKRETDIMGFLDAAHWGAATHDPLAADASFRNYRRMHQLGKDAILMNAPPEVNEPITVFQGITERLRDIGLSAPEIHAADADQGLMLIEDLGAGLYADLLKTDPAQEVPFYKAAIEVLLHLHERDAGKGLPPYDHAVYMREAALLTDWYLAKLAPVSDAAKTEYLDLMAGAVSDTKQSVLVMRDYHAENLLWLPDRDGVAKVGLLDYQDALLGDPAYDLVSLLEDARRDTSPALQEQMLHAFIDASGADDATFRKNYASLGAQRNAKIIGIFARLAFRDGKVKYLSLLPRVWAHFQRDLSHPALAGLKAWVDAHVPAPTDAVIQKLTEAAHAA